MIKTTHATFYGENHDHRPCVDSALQKAGEICVRNDVRFTPIRRRILELIWSSHRPVLAYELLNRLRKEKNNAEPPTIYRALDFLFENQLIHRIESLNAYVGCHYPDRSHISQFLICTDCSQVAEMDDTGVTRAISEQASRTGFRVAMQNVEIMGQCPICQQNQ